MKIMIISDLDVERGRGPITRLACVLPELGRRAEVVLAALGPADATCAAAIGRSAVTVHPVDFALDGWDVAGLDTVVSRLLAVVTRERPDVVVLYREIWDLAYALEPALAGRGIPFLLMPHSIPFLDSMARPTRSFVLDFVRRLATERRGYAARYMLAHAHQAPLLRRLPTVLINETLRDYLDGYFPRAPRVLALPGYALDLPSIDTVRGGPKRYDVAFMAKLTAGKGVFDLLAVMRRLRAARPGARMVVIGSFDDEPTRRRFLAARERLGLTDAVELAGWLSDADKYRVLDSARVFCYPSNSNDTFSLCLLEALACGLPAVCYDMPYVRAVYGRTSAVRAVRLRDTAAMAAGLDRLLDDPDTPGVAGREFAEGYASWSAVAEAEIGAYARFLRPAEVR